VPAQAHRLRARVDVGELQAQGQRVIAEFEALHQIKGERPVGVAALRQHQLGRVGVVLRHAPRLRPGAAVQ
jgi:hypothetical protein